DDVEGARDLLAQVRNVPFNRNSILFGITHRRTSFRTAFEQGANFVLEKPLAPDRALRSVRAAHALMLRERRRTFRHNIDTVVLLQLGRGAETRARGVDLSEGGMAIYLSVPPTLGAPSRCTLATLRHARFITAHAPLPPASCARRRSFCGTRALSILSGHASRPLCALSHRLSARGQRAHFHLQLALRAPPRRH